MKDETEILPVHAVIYCRVSSSAQAIHGHGLESQESRCRQHALEKGYEVEAVFPDDVSGGGDFMKRPGMVALLSYLDAQADKRYVVIFDDLKRFARDTEFHIKLRRAFEIRKARVECLNFKFDNSPEGRFIETILAAQGELERQQNGRQVLQKMQERMKKGYWTFRPPVGYVFGKVDGHGKLLVRSEPQASIVREALEGFASGRFATQSEVKRFLESQPCYPHAAPGYVRQQEVFRLLSRPIYAGFITHDAWNLNWVKAQHEPLITLETWHKIQERRRAVSHAPARKYINADFPLRGFVLCGDCDKPLTAGWSKGKYKKYPYYLCKTRGCPSCRKSIRKDAIEGDFADVVRTLQPSENLFAITRAMFNHAWS
ncbi:MAG: recombinase family protein [Roseovarius sp.]|nr:recombinase family protein [Roseovarius sp.]